MKSIPLGHISRLSLMRQLHGLKLADCAKDVGTCVRQNANVQSVRPNWNQGSLDRLESQFVNTKRREGIKCTVQVCYMKVAGWLIVR
jgi:hypothetical protein